MITRGLDQSTIDFEEGVWVHRIAVEGEPLPRLRGLAKIQKNVTYATAVHREVKRLSERCALDLVEAPIWDTEGLACLLDNDLTTVTSLQTTFKVLADMHPSWNDTSETPSLRGSRQRFCGGAARITRSPGRFSRRLATTTAWKSIPRPSACFLSG